MTRIYIEDNELDLNAELTNSITYAIDDLANLDSKTTSFSKTIVLPGTAKNNALLGNIFELNNSNFTADSLPNVGYNFNASKSAKCRIDVNGLQIIKGVFRLLEITCVDGIYEYECAVFGELGGFVSKLGNRRLEDLDFSAYDHDYTVANITGSWNNAVAGSGYYYPLIDIGNVSTNKKDYQYQALRPALFVREYIDKIITGAGYTWESNFFNTNFFKRLGIPHNTKQLTKVSSTGLDVRFGSTTQELSDGGGSHLITYNTLTSLGNFTTGDNGTFTYGGPSAIAGKLKLRLFGYYKYYGANELGITLNGSPDYIFPTTGTDFENFDITMESDITITPSGTYGAVIYANSEDFFYNVVITDAFLTFVSTSSIPVNVVYGEAIQVNDTIPRGIFQKDFFASILKMFYLMVTEDKFKDKHLIIEPYIDFFNTDPATYQNWSNLIDHSKVIKIKPMSEANARYYELKYKSDSDFWNEAYRKKYTEGYGDRIFDNGLEFAKEKETVEVIFSNSVLVGYAGEDKVVPTIYKKSGTAPSEIEDRIDHNIRIMQFKKITGVASWDIKNGGTVLGSYTDYGYGGHLDDPDAPDADICFGVPKELNFILASGDLSNNLSNTYYSPYLAEITDKDSRLLTCYVKLNEIDIYNLDFSKFIFIDGGLYRLQKVTDYTPGVNDTTMVDFLRVIYTTY